LITKTFPRRRTTTDPGLRFSDLIELRTFMADSSRPEALKLDVLLNTISIIIIPRPAPVAAAAVPGRWSSARPAGRSASVGQDAAHVLRSARHLG